MELPHLTIDMEPSRTTPGCLHHVYPPLPEFHRHFPATLAAMGKRHASVRDVGRGSDTGGKPATPAPTSPRPLAQCPVVRSRPNWGSAPGELHFTPPPVKWASPPRVKSTYLGNSTSLPRELGFPISGAGLASSGPEGRPTELWFGS